MKLLNVEKGSKYGKTAGDNPLDSLIQPISHNGHTTAVLEIDDESKQNLQKKTKSTKQRITVQISEDVLERLKNAVYWTPELTLASLAEEELSLGLLIY